VQQRQQKHAFMQQSAKLGDKLAAKDATIKAMGDQLAVRENEVIYAKKQRNKLRKTFN
jgi:hypothetical protein